MSNTTNCLYTTIRNLSGKTINIGFIPPHGFTLIAGQDYTFWGDLFNPGALGLSLCTRAKQSFETAILNGLIEVTQTPSPIFYDTVATRARMIGVSNGSLVVQDPCWGSYIGSF